MDAPRPLEIGSMAAGNHTLSHAFSPWPYGSPPAELIFLSFADHEKRPDLSIVLIVVGQHLLRSVLPSAIQFHVQRLCLDNPRQFSSSTTLMQARCDSLPSTSGELDNETVWGASLGDPLVSTLRLSLDESLERCLFSQVPYLLFFASSLF